MMVKLIIFFTFFTMLVSCTDLADFRNAKITADTLQFDSSDTSAPVPGNSGLLGFTIFDYNSITVTWTAATDNTTASNNLQYIVYYSLSNNLSSLSGILSAGTAFGAYAPNITSRTVNGLLSNTLYYFNVLVKDQNNLVNCYIASNFQIITTTPIPGAGGTITLGTVTSNSIAISWTKANDDITLQTNLQYRVYYSLTNNITNVQSTLANGTAVGSFSADIAAQTITNLAYNTTYYMNLLVFDTDNNTNCYTSTPFMITNSPPVPGNSGTIVLNSSGTNSLTINWTKANDDFSSQTSLQYLVYISTQNNMSTVSNAVANGTPVDSYATDINTKTINGLLPATVYYITILVRDDTGIVSDFSSTSFSTTQEPPVAGNNGLITLGALTTNSITINWTKATDDVSQQNTLQYQVFYSLSNNLVNVSNILTHGTPTGSYVTDIDTITISNLLSGTTYYFNILVKDQAGTLSNYTTTNFATTNSPALPGNSGVFTIGTVTSNAIYLFWPRANDDFTSQTNLQYLVYYSLSSNIGSVSNAVANGTPFGVYQTDLTNVTVTGLIPGTNYYFNVLVKDGAGNEASYLVQTATTPASNFLYRRLLTINSNKVSGTSNLASFPVLIYITNASLKSTGNGGKVESTNGNDIHFTAQDGTTTLSYEIEKYDAVNGRLTAWVRIPTLSYTVNTPIYLYYGKVGAVSQENAQGVWDASTSGVWHLNNSFTDSTSNGYTGVNNGTTPVAAKIANGSLFNGSSYIDMGNVLNQNTGPITFSAWVKRDLIGRESIITKSWGGTAGRVTYGYILAFDDNDYLNYWTASADTNWGSPGTFTIRSTTQMLDAQWHHIVCVIDRSANANCKLYIDGIDRSGAVQGDITTVDDITSTSAFRIGIENDNGFPIQADIDEVTVSLAARSAGWVITAYNSQNDPTTFFSIGSEETSW